MTLSQACKVSKYINDFTFDHVARPAFQEGSKCLFKVVLENTSAHRFWEPQLQSLATIDHVIQFLGSEGYKFF